jgi:hypothetical protein
MEPAVWAWVNSDIQIRNMLLQTCSSPQCAATEQTIGAHKKCAACKEVSKRKDPEFRVGYGLIERSSFRRGIVGLPAKGRIGLCIKKVRYLCFLLACHSQSFPELDCKEAQARMAMIRSLAAN